MLRLVVDNTRPPQPDIDIAGLAREVLAVEKKAIDAASMLLRGTVFPIERVMPGTPLYRGDCIVKKLLLNGIEPRSFAEWVRKDIAGRAMDALFNRITVISDAEIGELARHPNVNVGLSAISSFCSRYAIDRDALIKRAAMPVGVVDFVRLPVEQTLRDEIQEGFYHTGGTRPSYETEKFQSRPPAEGNFLEAVKRTGRFLTYGEKAYAGLIVRIMQGDAQDMLQFNMQKADIEKAVRHREAWIAAVRSGRNETRYNPRSCYPSYTS